MAAPGVFPMAALHLSTHRTYLSNAHQSKVPDSYRSSFPNSSRLITAAHKMLAERASLRRSIPVHWHRNRVRDARDVEGRDGSPGPA
jgi:hypothetical protein